MKPHSFGIVSLAIFALTGCALTPASSNGDLSLTTTASETSESSESPSYDEVWAVGSSLEITLSFSNAALYALSDAGVNYSKQYADVYFPATFQAKLGGKTYTYDEVGVRMKGATSRVAICQSDGSIVDVCHFKVSFTCTFDDSLYDLAKFKSFKHSWSDDSLRKARKSRRFGDMKKLDLKYLPRNDGDQTYSQDIYCYDVFNRNGIQAPKARWCGLLIKDAKTNKSSAYEAVESIDESFLSHHFGENDGDLYKCTQVVTSARDYTKADLSPAGAVATTSDAKGYLVGSRTAKGKIGVEDNYAFYHPNYDLKTNNDNGESSDFSKMVGLLEAAYNCRYASAPLSTLSAVLDLSEFLRFEAISYLLGNFDDQRNNYNNYYVYFRLSDGKAVYIPYDWDYSLGAHKTTDISSYGPFHQNSTHDSKDSNNLYWDTILTNASLAYSQSAMQSEYSAVIKEVVGKNYLVYATYTSFLSGLANRLSSSAELSSVKSYFQTKLSVI